VIVRKCSKGHDVKIINIDLSVPYNNEKYKDMYQVRCDVESNTCEFSEYYYNKRDAIHGWNIRELL